MVVMRLGTPSDVKDILVLAECFDRFGSYSSIFVAMLCGSQTELQSLGLSGVVALYLADDSAEAVGFVAVEWAGGVCHIHGIVVGERFRHVGIGRRMLEYVRGLACDAGVARLECLTAEQENTPALKCFEAFGFKNVGFAGFYPNRQRAVKLQLNLAC